MRGATTCDDVDVDVRLEPFCLDVTEVTVDAFADCVRAGKCDADLHESRRAHDA